MKEQRICCDMCGAPLDQHGGRYVVRLQPVPLYRGESRESYDLCLTCTDLLRGVLGKKGEELGVE